jgi:hypothetical protein
VRPYRCCRRSHPATPRPRRTRWRPTATRC